MNNGMKAVVTLVAVAASAGMVVVGLYGFLHELKNWGAPMLAGILCGFVTMCAAYNG